MYGGYYRHSFMDEDEVEPENVFNRLPSEIKTLIVSFIRCSECRKSLRLVNEMFKKLVGPPHTLSRLVKEIARVRPDRLGTLDWGHIASQAAGLLLFEEPELRHYMDPTNICRNEGISLSFVMEFEKDLNWPQCWAALSANSAILENDIRDNPLCPWDWTSVALNQSLSVDFFDDFRDKPIDWNFISHLSTADYLRFCDRPVNWVSVWHNHYPDIPDLRPTLIAQMVGASRQEMLASLQQPSILLEDVSLCRSFLPLDIFAIFKDYASLTAFQKVLSNFNNQPDDSEVFRRLSRCPDIKLKHLVSRPTAGWDFVSLGFSITLCEKLSTPQLPWSLTLARGEAPPPFTFVLANAKLNWPKQAMKEKPWYTAEVLLEQSHIPGASEFYSCQVLSSTVKLETVTRYLGNEWNFGLLSNRVEAPFLLEHAEIPWIWPTLSQRTWSLDVVLDPRLLPKWSHFVWQYVDLSTSGLTTLSNVLQHANVTRLALNRTLTPEIVAALKDKVVWPYHLMSTIAHKVLPERLESDFDVERLSEEISFDCYMNLRHRQDLKWNAANILLNNNIPIAEAIDKIDQVDDNCVYEYLADVAVEEYLDQDVITANLKYNWDFGRLSQWQGSNLCKRHEDQP